MKDLEAGPVEKQVWKEQLEAHAVLAGDEPRLFGYAIASDLARHYSFAEYLLLALTGELAEPEIAKAFEQILFFAAHLSVADAPIHATVLARLCGARTGGVLAVGAIALGEHAENEIELTLAELETGALGDARCVRSDAERAAVARLRAALPEGIAWPHDASLATAITAALRACGLVTAPAITMALTFARLPLACAEALCTKPGNFGAYPIDTPHFEYVPPAQEEGS